MSTSSSDSATALTQLAHNDSQPIDKLPDEILEQIFLILNKPRTFGIPSHESLKTSLRISWVCSRWRVVALSSREFWARCVSLESTSRKVRGVQLGFNIMQDEFIRRSDPWPLDLCGATIRAERLPIFADPSVARRTRSLRIQFQEAHLEYIFAFFNQSLPRLETICLSTTEGQVQTNFAISKGSLAGADNVKEIRCIYGVNFDLKSFLDEPTLIHRLTVLELNYIPTMIYCNYFLQFLAKARNLESLFLRTKIIFEPLSLEWQRGGIKLPKLKKVSVELSSPVAVAILQSVSFPSSLSTFVLKVSLQDIRHYPTILSGLEDLLRHWDRQWNHSVGIILDTDAVFFIEAIDSPMIIDGIDIGWPTHVSKFSFRVQDSKLADGNEPALTIRRATTHLAYTAIQAFESTILSAADRLSIKKSSGVPVTLDAVSSEFSTVNLAMNGSWNLLDGLLNNETLSNITELSLSLDSHPFIQHVHDRVVDSMQEAARRGVSEYSFLPKLRVITFGLLSRGDHLPLCRSLVEAGFLIERTVTLDLKVTLPGRYEGECPVQEAIEELLTVS